MHQLTGYLYAHDLTKSYIKGGKRLEELFKVSTDSERITISARDLHESLDVKTHFNDWFKRMCEYGFEEETDFHSFLSKSTGGRPSTDYQITIDMAKEIAMLQRTEKGKEIRQKLIQLEKDWNSPQKVMARALVMANKEIDTLRIDNERMKPKEIFTDAVSASSTSILVGDLAKILKQNGIEIGQRRLFAWMREKGYLIKRKGNDWNMPTQKAMDLKLFEIKESVHLNSNGCNVTTKTPKVTGKGQVYFINKFLNK